MSPQTGYPPLPTFRRQMVSYTCAWIPMTSMRPSAEIITRCPLWRKLLMNLCTFATSPSWMPAMDIGQSSSTRNPACLLTFNSPFGLVCSQDIFLKKIDQILEECQECIGIADNITIHGHTEAEHDACLQNLMQIACRYDLVFNLQKIHMKAQAISFFGCLFDANGVHPDPGKVDAVHALPAPTNVTKLQGFLGLVMYLSPFIPGLSNLTAPLHELLKKDTDFTWSHTYDATFQHVKEAVISDTTPRYFDPLTSHDDTSQCLTGRPWCSPAAKWQTHSFCQQGPY